MIESNSARLFELSKTRMPGGVNSPVRAYKNVGRIPRFIKSAKGSRIRDADGNEYIDYVGSWGPLILGHAHPKVLAAVREALEKGLSYGAPTENEYRLCELIAGLMPVMEKMRLVNSGTEATMSAIRLARGFTGRDRILKFTGCYHGHSDGLLVKAGSAALTTAVPDSAGVPAGYSELTLVADYNDEESVKALFDRYKGEIACVIVEPVAANMGVVPPKPGFLQFLRDITKKDGALLIFDEVITGFRVALGGACALYSVTPDLVTLGKIVGGGMPMAAYGGRADILEYVSPDGPVYQAGTLAGNPVATACGIATLTELRDHPEIYAKINRQAALIADALTEKFRGRAVINRVGSILSVFFTPDEVYDYKSAARSDLRMFAAFFNYLLDKGIYTAPSQFEAWFVSAAHTGEDLLKTAEVIKDCPL